MKEKQIYVPSKQDEVVFAAYVAVRHELLTPNGKINLPELIDRIMNDLASIFQQSGDEAYVRHACEKLGLLQPLCGTCVMKLDKKVEVNNLPPMLATTAAMKLWERLQENGWIDSNYQPLVNKRQAALLADYIGQTLQLPRRWEPFVALWNMPYLRADFEKAMSSDNAGLFLENLKLILSKNNQM